MLFTMRSKGWRGSIGLTVLLFAGVGCEGDTGTNPPPAPPAPPAAPARTYVMGWSPGPPRLDIDLFFQVVDPLDGLDRRKENPELVALGRSILEPEIRALHEE